jgi:hypothetical protein
MPYYADLTPYKYWDLTRHNVQPAHAVLNVGWLAKDQPFDTGPQALGLVDALLALPKVMQTRGWQMCPFCAGASGSAEIWVEGPDVTFAAPSLLPHYIGVHQYRPPDAFVAAALKLGESHGH